MGNAGISGTKPLVFVAMPFGKKRDATQTYEIDFDDIYERGIKPAMSDLGVECIRSDEERGGGIVHLTMFERLLLAEIAIVDITIPNANVFYELGVRHSALPRSTIIMWANQGTLPFDIAMVSAISYQLENGTLSEESASHLHEALHARMQHALEELESKDSPLFQLIPSFPGINLPHEVTEAFRDRTRYVDGIRLRLQAARRSQDPQAALREIAAVETELGDVTQVNAELIVDTLLSYRDLKAWDKMISLTERLPQWLSESSITIREQYALALNRRKQGEDRAKATAILESIIAAHGDSPETCGLVGRIYKDLYSEALAANQKMKSVGFLEQAIGWYRRGFTADPRDYYPGVNLATLLAVRNSDESIQELRNVLPAVTFAIGRLGGTNSSDPWQVATALELAVLGNDWSGATRALTRIASLEVPKMGIETMINNLSIIRTAEPQGISLPDLDSLITEMRGLM